MGGRPGELAELAGNWLVSQPRRTLRLGRGLEGWGGWRGQEVDLQQRSWTWSAQTHSTEKKKKSLSFSWSILTTSQGQWDW